MSTAVTRSVPVYRRDFFVVWLALIAVTFLSFWLGSSHGVSSREVANSVILVVAFVKVRCIGLVFMDVKDAPAALRVVFEVYCLGVCAALIAILVI